MSAFAFLFSELVQYTQNRVTSVSDLEKRLENAGYSIGLRVVELVSCRDRVVKRETRIVGMLQVINHNLDYHLTDTNLAFFPFSTSRMWFGNIYLAKQQII